MSNGEPPPEEEEGQGTNKGYLQFDFDFISEEDELLGVLTAWLSINKTLGG